MFRIKFFAIIYLTFSGSKGLRNFGGISQNYNNLKNGVWDNQESIFQGSVNSNFGISPQNFQNNHKTNQNYPVTIGKLSESWNSMNGKSTKQQFQKESGNFINQNGFSNSWNLNSKNPNQNWAINEEKTTISPQNTRKSFSSFDSKEKLQNNKGKTTNLNFKKNLNINHNNSNGKSWKAKEGETDYSSEDKSWNTEYFKPGKWQDKKSQFTGNEQWIGNQDKITKNKNDNSQSATFKTPSYNKVTPPPLSKGVKQDQTKNSSFKDHSILDELDKNEWYFRKSDFPEIDVNSNVKIDLRELWDFDKGKEVNRGRWKSFENKKNIESVGQNTKNEKNINKVDNPNLNKGHKNGPNRKNRDLKNLLKCRCVDVSLCNEENMVITHAEEEENYWSSFNQVKCEKLTEVCCNKPKSVSIVENNFSNEAFPYLSCGQTRFSDKEITNGFPWLLKLETLERTLDCEASLIYPQIALTVAHCVLGIQPEDLFVKSGVSSYEESFLIRRVVKIIIHPDFEMEQPRNDLALLVLQLPFEMNENVNTICLPATYDNWDLNRCVVAGWTSSQVTGSRDLINIRKGEVEFLPQSRCQKIMMAAPLPRQSILHDTFLCAIQKERDNFCLGNPGSPVICPSKTWSKTFLQIGIVSKSINCDYFTVPGLITNVLKFIDWINEMALDLNLFDSTYVKSLN